jgi:hypothetical protein
LGFFQNGGVKRLYASKIIVHGSRVCAGSLRNFFSGCPAKAFLGENLARSFEQVFARAATVFALWVPCMSKCASSHFLDASFFEAGPRRKIQRGAPPIKFEFDFVPPHIMPQPTRLHFTSSAEVPYILP